MSREKIYQSLWAAVLGFALAFGSLGCMATGMGLVSQSQITALAAWCAFWALGLSALNLLRGAPWFALLLPLGLAWRWFYGPLAASVERLVYEITTIYHSGYGWKVLSWTDHPAAGSVMPALRAVAVILLLPACACVTRRGSVWSALPLTMLPMFVTLALTDTVPASACLMLYLFGAIMLLLTQSVRQRQASQGNALCARIAVPVAAVLGLIFLLNPQKGYDKQYLADKIDKTVSSWLGVASEGSNPHTPGQTHTAPGGDMADAVSLADLGPKGKQTQAVMAVTASAEGRLYLRGGSFSDYTGQQWLVGDQTEYYDQWPAFRADAQANTLTVTTQREQSVVYLPYYAPELSELYQGRLENALGKTYSIHYYAMTADNVRNIAARQVDSAYTRLSADTLAWAQGQALAIIGREVDPQNAQEVAYAAQAIGRYVASSAAYSLNTPRMPKDEEDFARWFLEQSDTGYCTHFATAAAVLLRGAGIPARYVSGYAVEAQAGVKVQVTAAEAHAWVEYYLPGIGWTVLDPTPGSEGGLQPSPIVTTPPATTPQGSGPRGTTPPEQTLPGQTTAPDITTIPSPNPSGQTAPPAQTHTPKKGADLSWLQYLLWPMAVAAVIVGQWQLRLWLSRRELQSRRGKARAMRYWRRCERLAAQLGETPPQNIRALAQKAKFSQHTLTREELAQMRSYLASSEKSLRKRPWYAQLYYRLVLALY